MKIPIMQRIINPKLTPTAIPITVIHKTTTRAGDSHQYSSSKIYQLTGKLTIIRMSIKITTADGGNLWEIPKIMVMET